MSSDAHASLMVGAKLSDLATEKIITETVTRYNEITGEPYEMPITRYETIAGEYHFDGRLADNISDDEPLWRLLDKKGLFVTEAEDTDKVIVGLIIVQTSTNWAYGDGRENKSKSIKKVNEITDKCKDAFNSLGLEIKPKIFLAVAIG